MQQIKTGEKETQHRRKNRAAAAAALCRWLQSDHKCRNPHRVQCGQTALAQQPMEPTDHHTTALTPPSLCLSPPPLSPSLPLHCTGPHGGAAGGGGGGQFPVRSSDPNPYGMSPGVRWWGRGNGGGVQGQGCIRRRERGGEGGLAGTPLLLGSPYGPRRRQAKNFSS